MNSVERDLERAKDKLLRVCADEIVARVQLRNAIVAAFAANVGGTRIAQLAGLTRSRVYQIRDGSQR